MRAAARDLILDTHLSNPDPSSSGSRFAVLGSVPLAHLADVASDSDIVFRGEKGPRLEKISAICMKEMLDGALAEARARAEHGDLGALATTDPGHREPGVGTWLGSTVSRADTLGCPSQVSAPRERPPTRLHPTEHQMGVHGSSVGVPPRDPATANAPLAWGHHGRPAKLAPRPMIVWQASSAPPKGPISPNAFPI